ncbi:MAG: TonB-dependent receptor [Opitutaceae bacterium]|nr:TonB-dependent receptor [Opitutaceae bacterium]
MNFTGFKKNKKQKNIVQRLVAVSSIALMMGVVTSQVAAHAEGEILRFNMSSMPLSEALVNFSKKTNIVILAGENIIDDRVISSINGHYTAEEAIKLLLIDSKVKYVFKGQSTILIYKAALDEGSENTGYQSISFNTGAEDETNLGVYMEDENQDVGAGTQLEEIVVTATKRAVSVQSVAASVTALSGDHLAMTGVDDPSQLGKVVPGLVMGTQSGTGFVFLRGVGQTLGSPNLQPAISINMNGVYWSREMGATPFFDMERIEVLAGPQGTLWGRNAAGGAVNFVTKTPTDELEGNIAVEVGNYDKLHLTGVVNIPLSETAALRVAVDKNKHDGYMQNGTGDQDSTSIRASFSADLGDNLSIDITGLYNNEDGIESASFFYDASHKPDNFWNPDSGLLISDGLFHYLKRDTDLFLIQAEINYQINDDLTLTLQPAYINFEANNVVAFHVTTPTHFNNTVDQKTMEVRLANSGGGQSEWVVGLYWHDADHTLPVRPAVHVFGFPERAQVLFENHLKSYAAFGQYTYSLSDPLRVVAGLRYSEDEFTGTFRNDLAGIDSGVRAAKTNSLDWKLGVEYDLSDDSLLYATVQTGYIMGGFNGNAEALIIDPEELVSYTIGSKNTLYNNRLIVNVEAFYYDYGNYHLQAVSGQAIYPVFETFETAAKIFGAELSVVWQADDNDQLALTATLMSAEVSSEGLFTPWGVDMNGFQLPNAPSESIRGSWDHTFFLEGGGSVVSHVQAYYNSGYSMEHSHHPNTQQNSYALFDYNLTYHSPDENWNLEVYVQNITNTAVLVGANTPTVFEELSTPFLQAPRTIGAKFKVFF